MANGTPLIDAKSRFWVAPSRQLSWQSFTSGQEVNYPAHIHSEFNIVVCLAGRVEVTQYGHPEAANPGEAIIGSALIHHRSTYIPDAGACRAVSLTVSSDLFHEAACGEAGWQVPERDRTSIYFGKLGSPQVHSIAADVEDQLQSAGTCDTQRMETLGRMFLGATLRQWQKSQRLQERKEVETTCLPRWQFVQTHELMLRSGKDDFVVAAIAKRLGISTSRFHMLFRNSATLPPAQYFRHLLLQNASEKLAATDEQIKQISYEIGFRTPSHFCAVFKKHLGISPACYRRAHRGTHDSGPGSTH